MIYVWIIGCESDTKTNTFDGKTLYKKYCVNCHGIDGSLKTNGAIDLRYSTLSLDEKILVITKGRNVMTSFEKQISPGQINAVARYTETLKAFTSHE